MKRILAWIVLVLMIIGCVIPFLNKRNENNFISSRRTVKELDDPIILMDDEAIALADASNGNISLRAEAIKAYNLVNDKRISEGLKPFIWSSNLESVAFVRAEEASVSFSHTRPNGKAWYSVNSQIMAGENLAFGFDDAGAALKAWMNSPTHKENILWPEFSEIAIAVYVTDDGVWYWSQEFNY